VAAIAIMAIGAAMPINSSEAKTTDEELRNEFQYIATVPGIFGNNFFHSLLMFTPFIGPIYGGLVFFNTGYVVAIIAAARGFPTGLLFTTLFLYPHTWLEFFAYSLALSQSAFLAMAIIKGRFKQEALRTCVIITICALILLLAAVVEIILILLS
jgi:hypothetical protein